ncbi:MAG: 3-oxoacyl-[acyl-carrier-protein] reductase [Bacilli bacterium]
MDLLNKVALVTGGSKGIGRAICLALASAGAKVIVNYRRSEAEAYAVVKEITDMGGEALAIKADVSNFQEAEMLMQETLKAYGNLHILVNNAGITDDALMLRMSFEQFNRVIDTDLKGVWNMTKQATKTLLKAGYGRIINIASVSGLVGNVGQANYSAAKAGVIGLTKALAKEFASRNVTVNAIAPGLIDTEMTQKLSVDIINTMKEQIPLKRLGTVTDVANAACFLASSNAGYITGQTIVVDGGLVM